MLKKMFEKYSDEQLRVEFDDLTSELKRARLEAQKAKVELDLKELDCKDAEIHLDVIKEQYDALVEVMSQRDGE